MFDFSFFWASIFYISTYLCSHICFNLNGTHTHVFKCASSMTQCDVFAEQNADCGV